MGKMMMVRLLLLGMLALGVSGCGEKIFVNGAYYRVLDQNELLTLKEYCRVTLLQSDKVLTPAQKELVRSAEPQMRLIYSGDKAGRATFEWTLGKTDAVRVICEGKFFAYNMHVSTKMMEHVEELKNGRRKTDSTLTLEPFVE